MRRGCGVITLPVNPRRAGVEARPYGVWGGGRDKPKYPVDRRTAHRGRCALRPSCSVQQQIHVVGYPTEGASGTPPPTVVARCGFQRSHEVQFPAPVTLYAATSVALLPVGCIVLGAPWLRDCRAGLDADVRRDRFCPRLSRRVRFASTAPRIQSRGHSPRTISYGRPKLSVIPGREGVEARPYGVWGRFRACNRRRPSSEGGASGTPPLTGGLFTSSCCIRRKGTARAPFFTGAPALFIYPTPGGRGSPPLRCVGKISASHSRRPQPLSHAASRRDSSPFRGAEREGCGAPASSFISRRAGGEGIRVSPTSPATPQSRREAP